MSTNYDIPIFIIFSGLLLFPASLVCHVLSTCSHTSSVHWNPIGQFGVLLFIQNLWDQLSPPHQSWYVKLQPVTEIYVYIFKQGLFFMALSLYNGRAVSGWMVHIPTVYQVISA